MEKCVCLTTKAPEGFRWNPGEAPEGSERIRALVETVEGSENPPVHIEKLADSEQRLYAEHSLSNRA